jgi:phage shock protein PspC (stress-responsive transcriptional regulator)
MSEEEPKRMYRSRTDRVIAGVCAGLGKYFNVDPVLIRVIWLVLVLAFGTGILAYLIAWLVMPPEPMTPEAEVYHE